MVASLIAALVLLGMTFVSLLVGSRFGIAWLIRSLVGQVAGALCLLLGFMLWTLAGHPDSLVVPIAVATGLCLWPGSYLSIMTWDGVRRDKEEVEDSSFAQKV